MRRYKLILSILSILLLFGCAGPSIKGKQMIVERSHKVTPNWINQPFFEKNDMLYFSGGVKGVVDYALGLREAKAEAIKNLVESVKTKARTQLTEMTRGSNMNEADLGKFIEDGVALTSTNLEISGIMPKEQYFEKIEESTEEGVKYLYNCYVLLELSVKDYKQARKRAIEGLLEQAKKENNALAEQEAKKLLEKLEKE
jgi:hypothetical protein